MIQDFDIFFSESFLCEKWNFWLRIKSSFIWKLFIWGIKTFFHIPSEHTSLYASIFFYPFVAIPQVINPNHLSFCNISIFVLWIDFLSLQISCGRETLNHLFFHEGQMAKSVALSFKWKIGLYLESIFILGPGWTC